MALRKGTRLGSASSQIRFRTQSAYIQLSLERCGVRIDRSKDVLNDDDVLVGWKRSNLLIVVHIAGHGEKSWIQCSESAGHDNAAIHLCNMRLRHGRMALRSVSDTIRRDHGRIPIGVDVSRSFDRFEYMC